MIIQHNTPAMNSRRRLGINRDKTKKTLEKLASGYRINRGADDAAGLAISEKMRGQIRGLSMAERNTSNGIDLLKTAEGAMNEIHSILQRMRELAVQSSNGTYHDYIDEETFNPNNPVLGNGSDRLYLNREFQALKDEIDRISNYTNYNSIKLLNGTLNGKTTTVEHAYNIGNWAAQDIDAIQLSDFFTDRTGGNGEFVFTRTQSDSIFRVEYDNGGQVYSALFTTADDTIVLSAAGSTETITIKMSTSGTNNIAQQLNVNSGYYQIEMPLNVKHFQSGQFNKPGSASWNRQQVDLTLADLLGQVNAVKSDSPIETTSPAYAYLERNPVNVTNITQLGIAGTTSVAMTNGIFANGTYRITLLNDNGVLKGELWQHLSGTNYQLIASDVPLTSTGSNTGQFDLGGYPSFRLTISDVAELEGVLQFSGESVNISLTKDGSRPSPQPITELNYNIDANNTGFTGHFDPTNAPVAIGGFAFDYGYIPQTADPNALLKFTRTNGTVVAEYNADGLTFTGTVVGNSLVMTYDPSGPNEKKFEITLSANSGSAETALLALLPSGTNSYYEFDLNQKAGQFQVDKNQSANVKIENINGNGQYKISTTMLVNGQSMVLESDLFYAGSGTRNITLKSANGAQITLNSLDLGKLSDYLAILGDSYTFTASIDGNRDITVSAPSSSRPAPTGGTSTALVNGVNIWGNYMQLSDSTATQLIVQNTGSNYKISMQVDGQTYEATMEYGASSATLRCTSDPTVDPRRTIGVSNLSGVLKYIHFSAGDSIAIDATQIEHKEAEGLYDGDLTGYWQFIRENKDLILQIGANGGDDQRLITQLESVYTTTLGNDDNKVSDLDLLTIERANLAIDVLDDAINQIAGYRADIGAVHNRLEHALNNLGVTKENLTSAESTIRDVDMALEMMEFTRSNILSQAAQAMLAQAQQLPQGVVSLLQ